MPPHPEHFWGCSDLLWVEPPWQLCLPLCLCGQKSPGFPGIPYSTPSPAFRPPQGAVLCPLPLDLNPPGSSLGKLFFFPVFFM